MFLQKETSLGPSTVEITDDYIIELSGVDGRGNGLQGIFITVARGDITANSGDISNSVNPIYYGLILHDSQRGVSGEIIDISTLTEEELNYLLGSILYNGHSKFFFNRADMLLRLLPQDVRDELVQELLPDANEVEVTEISDQLLRELLPMYEAFGMLGLNNVPVAEVDQWVRYFLNQMKQGLEYREASRRLYNEIMSMTPAEKAAALAALARSEAIARASLLAARLGLIGLVIIVGSITGGSAGYCIFRRFIAPGLDTPDIPTENDVNFCEQRRENCLANYDRRDWLGRYIYGRETRDWAQIMCRDAYISCKSYIANYELIDRARKARQKLHEGFASCPIS